MAECSRYRKGVSTQFLFPSDGQDLISFHTWPEVRLLLRLKRVRFVCLTTFVRDKEQNVVPALPELIGYKIPP